MNTLQSKTKRMAIGASFLSLMVYGSTLLFHAYAAGITNISFTGAGINKETSSISTPITPIITFRLASELSKNQTLNITLNGVITSSAITPADIVPNGSCSGTPMFSNLATLTSNPSFAITGLNCKIDSDGVVNFATGKLKTSSTAGNYSISITTANDSGTLIYYVGDENKAPSDSTPTPTNIEFNASVDDATITVGNKTRDVFFAGSPKLAIRISNNGNIPIQPYGDIFIYKNDRSKSIAILPFNSSDTVINEKEQKEFTFKIVTNGFINENESSLFKKINFTKFFDFKFGRYYATYQPIIKPSSLSLQNSSTILADNKTVSFFVFPIQILTLILIITVIIIGTIIRKIWKHERISKGNFSKLRQ